MTADLAPAGLIGTRIDFFVVLQRTLKIARSRAALVPFWGAHASIAAQLQAMADWTAAGRAPTPEERERISIGIIAIREFDAEPESEEAGFVECLQQLARYFAQWPDDPPEPGALERDQDYLSPGLKLLLQRRVGLVASAMQLAPGAATRASLHAALRANAEHVRLPELPDDLNPMVLDPARVDAFIEGLPRQSEKTLSRIEGRWLALGVEGLHLSTASPVEADAIEGGFDLMVPDEDATVVQSWLRLPLRLAYAERVAAHARAALQEFETEVAELEAGGALSTLLAQARWRRFAAATVWRIASKCLTDRSPAFSADFRKASDAVRRYLMPPWVELPPR